LAIVWVVERVPTGFVPDEDKGLLIAEVRMPVAASQSRTLEVIKRVESAFLACDGVNACASFQGFSLIAGNGSNYGVVFAGLEPWSERLPKLRTQHAVLADVREQCSKIQEGFVLTFVRPALEGLGSGAGFDLRIEDRGGVGPERLQQFVDELVADGNMQSKLRGLSSPYQAGVRQLFADIDREKAKKLGLSLADVFSTLSVNLGSTYVNDFNKYGRTWQVEVQAEGRFRANAEQVRELRVRNQAGRMIPLGSILDVDEALGPDRVIRYNLYPSAVINGTGAPGVSTGDALALVEDMIEQKQPAGIGFEWTALSFQERRATGIAILVFGLALAVVYLILAAVHESWTVPLVVVLSIPLCVIGAMLGLMWRGMENNLFTQVGLVMLVGLGAKNAILIVEFARAHRAQGMSLVDAVVAAGRQRLRPILMTAMAFCLGVLPLVFSTGAGSTSSQSIATAVVCGMIGNTLLGLVFTPVLYVTIERLFGRKAMARG